MRTLPEVSVSERKKMAKICTYSLAREMTDTKGFLVLGSTTGFVNYTRIECNEYKDTSFMKISVRKNFLRSRDHIERIHFCTHLVNACKCTRVVNFQSESDWR